MPRKPGKTPPLTGAEAVAKHRRLKSVSGLCEASGCHEKRLRGYTLCREHREAKLAAVKAYNAERLEAGLCRRCDNPHSATSAFCVEHDLALSSRNAKLYEERKAAGICVRNGCGRSASPGRVLCDFHRGQTSAKKTNTNGKSAR